ncbi:vWA domain-containing protein [Deinococcus sonorensis]|uniref:VWA domain-containing protein n=2 Tax=Deinococcus sonorensis TaxID=309891 RepID=A0AAU7UFX0_9DEIO
MTEPRIELLPLHTGLNRDHATLLTVLARIHAPQLPRAAQVRPPLNLALVIDRSGSMSGQPLQMARAAARAAVQQLSPRDRLSIVTFDDTVQLVVPSQHVTDPEALQQAIDRIECGGSTALYAGWLEGATQVATHLQPGALNRVILLTDGQANVGPQRSHDIAPQVEGLAQRGVSTSAIGLGAHYDEDLLLAVANAGDGNFEHVERPEALPAFFEQELLGLSRTVGRVVSLGLEPNPEHDVRVTEVLNDLKRAATGRLQLPNLLDGQTTDVVLRLKVPAQPGRSGTLGVLRVRLAWSDAQGRHTRRAQLNLPLLDSDAYGQLPEDAEVQAAVTVLETARLKREGVDALDRGDRVYAARAFSAAVDLVSAAPASAATRPELAELQALQGDLAAGRDAELRKRAVSQSYDRSRSKPRR